jgi:hypothetical protein
VRFQPGDLLPNVTQLTEQRGQAGLARLSRSLQDRDAFGRGLGAGATLALLAELPFGVGARGLRLRGALAGGMQLTLVMGLALRLQAPARASAEVHHRSGGRGAEDEAEEEWYEGGAHGAGSGCLTKDGTVEDRPVRGKRARSSGTITCATPEQRLLFRSFARRAI